MMMRTALFSSRAMLFAMTLCAWPGSQTFAAVPPENYRSVPGSVSLSDPRQRSARCANLRKAYAQSEACFARYRRKNGGLRPGAFQRCKQLKDPSSECGRAGVP